MYEIRPYVDTDYVGVRSNLEAAGSFEEVADAQDNLRSMIQTNPDAILVAISSDEVVGTIYTTPFGANVCFIWKLAVAEHRRRQGIASRLLEEVVKRSPPTTKEIWGYIDIAKHELPEFYARNGYVHVADHAYNPIYLPIVGHAPDQAAS